MVPPPPDPTPQQHQVGCADKPRPSFPGALIISSESNAKCSQWPLGPGSWALPAPHFHLLTLLFLPALLLPEFVFSAWSHVFAQGLALALLPRMRSLGPCTWPLPCLPYLGHSLREAIPDPSLLSPPTTLLFFINLSPLFHFFMHSFVC